MKAQRVAFVYPGQGSQGVGMGRDLVERLPDVSEKFRQAADLVGEPDLLRFMLEGPEEELRRTDRTQPALFLVETALHNVLSEGGIKPVIVAGHSLGEYSALYAAGVLGYEEALRLVGRRGVLMHEGGGAPGAGAMAAVLGLDDALIEEVIAAEGGAVVVANYNGPGQTVISGDLQAVERAAGQLKEAGARRVLMLPVSGAFHSPLMQGPSHRLAEELERTEFMEPLIPVISNVDAFPHKSAEQLKSNLQAQMTGSVRWTETVKAIVTYGVDAIVEVGPGAVLTGVIKRIDNSVPTYNVATLEDAERLLADEA